MTVLAARPPLLRPRRVVLAGVCAGLAGHLTVRPGAVRMLFAALAVCGGAGVLLYLWIWAFVPLQPIAGTEAGTDRTGPDARVVRRILPVALLLVVAEAVAAILALAFLPAGYGIRPAPGALESVVLGASAFAWNLAADRHDPTRGPRYAAVVRIASAAALIVEGGGLLLLRPNTVTVVLAVALLVVGAIGLALPRLIAIWSGLLGERAARAQQTQRAEIAAHLHDSVLQTLAIIQNRAGPQSEIARLARAQERELRDWLFAGTDPFAGDVATELRTAATALELDHPVRIDVVSVGDAVPNAALVGAAREAMLNAARHAGGDVSVYIETGTDAIDVFVRDRGHGFDPDRLPDGRMGIRESIVGRMRRAGGIARIRSDADGTEVQLRMPRRAGA